MEIKYLQVSQDINLAENQKTIKAGDNGIFKGIPTNNEVKRLSQIARDIYKKFPDDGKYILDNNRLIICQSNATNEEIEKFIGKEFNLTINPLGFWTGGINVDTGATNRKLGSDMGEAVTGGGLHGKDLSKADVSINIYTYLKAQEENKEINICCAIGDNKIDGKDYEEIVEIAREYIRQIGGFEKFAEWGLI
ncbi:S-adenosylmethionine synthetase [Candidatus Gracilibacteria bacterium]|nr:S-adenosylmethionine synthetase [Candidatus Gracilibacteria bacterium]